MIKDQLKELTDEELMKIFIDQRDSKTFTQIYDRYYEPLCKYIYWQINDIDQAKDISQSIFSKVFTNPNLFDTSKAFNVWIFTVAKYNWLNYVRNKSVESNFLIKFSNLHANYHETEDSTLDSVKISKMEKSMSQLSENHKEVVTLKYSNNLTIREISRILNCNEGTVKSRLFYALKNLKKLIENGEK